MYLVLELVRSVDSCPQLISLKAIAILPFHDMHHDKHKPYLTPECNATLKNIFIPRTEEATLMDMPDFKKNVKMADFEMADLEVGRF